MVDTPTASRRVTQKGGIGKLVRGALYVHRDAIALISHTDQQRIAHAASDAPLARWNVVRIEPTLIGLLEYDDFEIRAFPRLLSSTKVDAPQNKITTRDYRNSHNPLILHRKELLVSLDHPCRAAWAGLTERLENLGLFREPARIGRLRVWNKLLASVHLDAEGQTI